MITLNTFGTRTEIRSGGQTVQIYSLPALEKAGFPGVSRLPYSMKILLENLLRREDAAFVKADDIRAVAQWNATAALEQEISFMPARVLLQDFTGVPCVVDLAAMRDAIVSLGGNPDRI
ncbi:MAG: aconitate hydratase, partial [Acidobacteria bacterium]|nr:aconitate hydratase [Acidobacteriota bacterium]